MVVTNTAIERLQAPVLQYPSDDWKRLVWTCQRGQSPRQLKLAELGGMTLLIGHTTKGMELQNYQDWRQIAENDLLPVDDGSPATQYLLVSRKRGRFADRLTRISISDLQNDQKLSTVLRQSLKRPRWKSIFAMLTLLDIHFVHLELHQEDLVDIRKQTIHSARGSRQVRRVRIRTRTNGDGVLRRGGGNFIEVECKEMAWESL
jgi:hypothetical protein